MILSISFNQTLTLHSPKISQRIVKEYLKRGTLVSWSFTERFSNICILINFTDAYFLTHLFYLKFAFYEKSEDEYDLVMRNFAAIFTRKNIFRFGITAFELFINWKNWEHFDVKIQHFENLFAQMHKASIRMRYLSYKSVGTHYISNFSFKQS